MMNIEERMMKDPEFYVIVQKSKIIFCVIGLPVCYFLGCFDDILIAFGVK